MRAGSFMPRSFVLIVLSALLALAGLAQRAALAAEEILRFDSRIEVREDGDLVVTERITARAEGRRIRRGIYRDFPLLFRKKEGAMGRVGFKVLQVSRNGRPEPWRRQTRDGVARIYIGDENTLLAPGTYTWTIRYRTSRQIRHFDGHDELYWNVTGHEWDFPILAARVEVRLPPGARILKAAVFTGPAGARGQDARVIARQEGRFIAETTRALIPGEGFTIALAVPKGVIAPPSPWRRLWWALTDDMAHWWLLAGAIGLNLYFLFAWWRVGRDPPAGPVTPVWDPPRDLSPALAAWLDGEENLAGDNTRRMLPAAIVSLATKGYLRIHPRTEEQPHTRLEKLKEPDDTLPPEERELMNALFAAGPSIALNETAAAPIAEARARVLRTVEELGERRLIRRNDGWFMAGVALAVIVAAGLLVMAVTSMPGAQQYLVMAMFLTIPAIMLFMGLRNMLAREGLRARLAALPQVLFPLFFIGVFALGFVPMLRAQAPGARMVWAAAAIAALPLGLMLWRWLLKAPTPRGRRMMDALAGLRLFIETAEKGRLDMAGKNGAPEMSALLYEKLLPHAMALGLEKPWTSAFRAWLATAAAAGAAGAAAHWHPGWYAADDFRLDDLGGGLGESMAADLAVSVPSHGDSAFGGGFGGGGFGGGGVGGGGGGGGGGGW